MVETARETPLGTLVLGEVGKEECFNWDQQRGNAYYLWFTGIPPSRPVDSLSYQPLTDVTGC